MRSSMLDRCISFDSYIKPQPMSNSVMSSMVVYLLTPTSNHNAKSSGFFGIRVVYLLTPTSNHNTDRNWLISSMLYIFWLLHQTTTSLHLSCHWVRCISFDSYIKPQPYFLLFPFHFVVYLLTPTSNHNWVLQTPYVMKLYIFWLLHQTTTYRFGSTDFQHITITFSNKKWWVEYNFLCKSTKKIPIE